MQRFFVIEVRDHLTRFYNLPPLLPATSAEEVVAIREHGYDLSRGLTAMQWVLEHRPDFEHARDYRRFLIKWPLILEVRETITEHDFSGALMRLDALVTIDPDDPSAHYHLGVVYRYIYNFPRSELSLRNCLKLYPELAIAHRALGYTLAFMERKAEALAELEIAAQELRGDPELERALLEIKQAP
jgi:tetratricopeptide (TPR) repeat protein